jgi:hypothetical protein
VCAVFVIALARVAPQAVPIELWLETGEILYLGDKDAAELYEALWLAAPHVRGAVIAAAKVRRAQTTKRHETFNPLESAAVQAALAALTPHDHVGGEGSVGAG